MAQSAMLTPAARTWMRTSPSAIAGLSMSRALQDSSAVAVLNDCLHRWFLLGTVRCKANGRNVRCKVDRVNLRIRVDTIWSTLTR